MTLLIYWENVMMIENLIINIEMSIGTINRTTWTIDARIQWKNRIGGVMVSMLASNAVGRGFVVPLGQTKD
jgi:hypothetical protein